MMTDLRDAVLAALGSRLRVTAAEDSEYVTLPLSFSTGNLIELKVTRVASDFWAVSDQNAAVAELTLRGLDLDSGRAADSWDALVRQMRADAPLMVDRERFELAAGSTTENLGATILEVAQTAQRAEMLRVLVPGYRARSFREEVVARVGAANLPFVAKAPMPTRHNGRRNITVKVDRPQPIYMQAISGKTSAIDGFDKAQAIFSTAAVETTQLVAVLADKVHLDSWQWETLREAGQPIYESELDGFLSLLATVA